ncbi:MAG: HAMP domain-containing protein [Myxococcales bacterium]|nr:HAMP domain-containing protein [Myxococcales bacterium]
MRLTWKLTLAIWCVIAAVMSVNAWMRVQRESELFEYDIRRDHVAIGRALAEAAGRVWQTNGEGDAFEIVEDANIRESQVLIRWVWLDAPDGDPRRPELPRGELRRAAPGQVTVVKQRPRGERVDAIFTCVPITGPRPAAIELRESLAGQQDYVRTTIVRASLYAGALVILCGATVLGLGIVLVALPARKLVEHARRIGAGDLSVRLRLPQRDEMGALAIELNHAAERLGEANERVETETKARFAALEQMQHGERLANVGKLAAGIAHEVGTPLNVVTGHAQLITEEYPEDSSAYQNASIITGQAHRVTAIMRQLLDFARRREPVRASQDMVALARQSASLVTSLALKKGIQIELELPEGEIRAWADTGQIQQVLTNLLVNGIHATAAGGVLTLGVESREVQPPADRGRPIAKYVRLYVRDRGAGISPEIVRRIFEPFFTTKDVGEGTGLGLAVAHGIVKEHDGFIDVETELGKGSCFSVYLPPESTS